MDNITHLPLVRNAKTVETLDMLDDALALVSVGVAALKMLETLLPSAALNVEEATKALANQFMVLAQSAKSQSALAKELVTLLRLGSDCDDTVINEFQRQVDRNAKNANTSVAHVVMTMQFQDRNTQITENAAHVLQQYGNMLADIRDRISLARGGGSVDAGVSHAAKAILAGIRIGDIRKHFIDALAEVNLQYAMGQPLPAREHDLTENVELF